MRTAELVRSKYPDLPIFARARNRNHAHRLLDIGVTNLQRETFLSSLDIVEFVMELEEEFDIQIPDDQAEKIKTVGEAVDYIEKAIKDKPSQ